MNQYERYKDSGIKWIGKIPDHWRVAKAKFCSSFRMGQTILKEELIEDGKYPVFSATEGDHLFGKINNPSFILRNGDIVIPARGNSIGHITLIQEDSVCTQTTIANFVDREKIDSKYLFYFYKGFRDILFHYDNTAIPQITVEKVKQNPILFPSFLEQTQIVKFLDHQTSIIDELINKKIKLIDLLKEKRQAIVNEVFTKGLNPKAEMKDSGIEWIGNIPEHWDLVKSKYITEHITDGAHISPDLSSPDFPFISTVDLNRGEIDWDTCLKTSKENYENLVKNGCKPLINDILYSKDGTIGKTTVISQEIDFVVASSLIIIRPILSKVIPLYLEYLLRSHMVKHQIDSVLSGVALRRISLQKFSNLILLLPPLVEQENILKIIHSDQMTYLDAILKIRVQIDKIKEYRKSIITEAVTGKIDLRNWQPLENY